MSSDDGELWEKWRGGDALAFERIVRRHAPRLLAVAARLVRDGVEADEVVQEAFIAAWRGASGFDGRAQLGTWLHRITINTALRRLRRGHERREVSMEQAFPPGDEGLPADAPDTRAAEAVEQSEITSAVWRAIEGLDEAHRTVLVLRDIEELSSKEVALALHISDATVRQRLHRARQTIAEHLRPELRGADAITCGGRLDLLFDHLDGDLEDDLRVPVGAHVAGCATCTALASGYGVFIAEIKAASPAVSPSRSQSVTLGIVDGVRARMG